MNPERIPSLLHFSHLDRLGGADITPCEKCHTWNNCSKYREVYEEFNGGRIFWLCDDCGGIGK